MLGYPCIQIGYSVRKNSSTWVIQLYLLVDFCLQRSSSFVEFRIFLALTEVFDDFLIEVTFRVDISITDQFVSSNEQDSSFVEFHIISISSNLRNSIIQITGHFRPLFFKLNSRMASKATKMTSYDQHMNNNSRMTSLRKNI